MPTRGRPRKADAPSRASSDANSDIASTLKQVLSEMRDLKQSQEYMSDSNDDFLAELKKVTVEQKNMKNELHSVASRQTKVFSELDDIKRRLNKLEGEKIASGVVVRGMDETDDATASLVQLANALEVHVDAETDIIKAQWIQVRRNDQSTALMTVTAMATQSTSMK